MPVGEVISALCKHASSFDGDSLLMLKSICSIDVEEDKITLYFIDSNTEDYIIQL